jgi:hypothetical protein
VPLLVSSFHMIVFASLYFVLISTKRSSTKTQSVAKDGLRFVGVVHFDNSFSRCVKQATALRRTWTQSLLTVDIVNSAERTPNVIIEMNKGVYVTCVYESIYFENFCKLIIAFLMHDYCLFFCVFYRAFIFFD